MPKISVTIPLWNKKPYIKDALLSVINQTYRDFEIIVVDDGSTDRSVDVVKNINDPRIKILMQDHKGQTAARNRGISEANADLFTFLDADDEWMPTFLETVMRLYTRYPQAGLFAIAYKVKKPDGHFEKPRYKFLPSQPWEGILPNYFRAALSGYPLLIPSAVMIKKEVLQEVGYFPEGERAVDLDLFAKIAFRYPIAWSSSVEMIYRRDVIDSIGKRTILKKDIAAINTLKAGFSQCSESIKEDVSNLISKYYKFCSLSYFRQGDSRNALRCIRESIRYAKGRHIMKPIVMRMIMIFPVQVWQIARNAHSLFNKYHHGTK